MPSIPLSLEAAQFPDGTASNLAPGVAQVKSSAGAPSPYFLQLLFDAAQLEQCMWSFLMPADYVSAPKLRVRFKMTSATSGNVIIIGRIAATSSGDATDEDAKGFAAANTSAATAVPGTAGYEGEILLDLTNADSLAADDHVIVYLARDGANGSDTATGDMEVVAVSLEYS